MPTSNANRYARGLMTPTKIYEVLIQEDMLKREKNNACAAPIPKIGGLGLEFSRGEEGERRSGRGGDLRGEGSGDWDSKGGCA